MDVDTVAVHASGSATRRTAPGCSDAPPRRRMVAGSTARLYALCISPMSRPPRSPSGIACWPNADLPRPRHPSRPPRMAARRPTRRPQHTGTAGPRNPHSAHARTTNLATVSGCGRAAVPCGFRRHSRAQRRSSTRTCQLHLRPRRLASRRLPALRTIEILVGSDLLLDEALQLLGVMRSGPF
jgi:hypothetical protein